MSQAKGAFPSGKADNRMIQEHIHDSYKMRRKIHEPSICTKCRAVYANGRWSWDDKPSGADEIICPACHRERDKFPAGEIRLSGDFFNHHREEIIHLARNEEVSENKEHPQNRIMQIAEEKDEVLVTTTDIHLPRRIGHAIESAYDGELHIHYEEESYAIRVTWRR